MNLAALPNSAVNIDEILTRSVVDSVCALQNSNLKSHHTTLQLFVFLHTTRDCY